MQYKDKILIVEGHAIFQLWFFSLVQCKKYLLNVYNATVFSAWMQSVLNLFEHDSFSNFLLIWVYTIKYILAWLVLIDNALL